MKYCPHTDMNMQQVPQNAWEVVDWLCTLKLVELGDIPKK
jgi:hypothetical protein